MSWNLFKLFKLFVAMASLAAQAQPARIDIFLHATNAVDLIALKTSVDSGFALLSRTNDLRTASLTRTNNGNGVDYHVVLFATDANAAESAFNSITNLVRPPQSSGRILIHRCPVDGDPRFRQWAGCDAPAAQLRTFRWP